MNPTLASRILGPTTSLPDPTGLRKPQYLADTGTTESHNPNALAHNQMATLLVGLTSVRVMLSASGGLSDVVATTDIILGPGSTFTWMVDSLTRHAYVEAADGASPYEAWVWKSS